MAVEVTFKGPFFDGRFGLATREIAEDAQYEVGNAALERVHRFLDQSIKNPTPYYETQIIQQLRGAVDVVHDRGIVYGPWLEGTSSRNSRTKFKGYSSFRRATQAVEKLAPSIVERVIAKNIGRLQ